MQFQMCVWVVGRLPQRLKSMFLEKISSIRWPLQGNGWPLHSRILWMSFIFLNCVMGNQRKGDLLMKIFPCKIPFVRLIRYIPFVEQFNYADQH